MEAFNRGTGPRGLSRGAALTGARISLSNRLSVYNYSRCSNKFGLALACETKSDYDVLTGFNPVRLTNTRAPDLESFGQRFDHRGTSTTSAETSSVGRPTTGRSCNSGSDCCRECVYAFSVYGKMVDLVCSNLELLLASESLMLTDSFVLGE